MPREPMDLPDDDGVDDMIRRRRARAKARTMRFLLLGGLVAAVVVVTAATVLFLRVKTRRADDDTAGGIGGSTTRPAHGGGLVVSAYDLWTAYGDNAAAADAKYKGKWVRSAGSVGSIRPDGNKYRLGFTVVASGSVDERVYQTMTAQEKKWFNEGYPPGVVATFTADRRASVAGLKKDQAATVTGRCEGRVDDPAAFQGYYVILADCEVAP